MLKKILFISLTSSALLYSGGECSRNDIVKLKEAFVKLVELHKKQEKTNKVLEDNIASLTSKLNSIKEEVRNVKNTKISFNPNLYRVKENAVNVRKEPSIHSKIIGVVRRGQIVTIDSIGEKWTKLAGQGYIRNYLLHPVVISQTADSQKDYNQTK